MNREEIIRMAREAGFKVDWQHADVAEIKAKRYEYFAALVAAAERDACASVAESYEPRCDTCPSGVANAIRARGKHMNTYPLVYLTYHGDGNVGIGTPPDASAPLGEPVEHLRVSMTDGAIWNKAIAQEREACIELVLQGTDEPVQTKTLEILRKERERIAAAIRARSNQCG